MLRYIHEKFGSDSTYQNKINMWTLLLWCFFTIMCTRRRIWCYRPFWSTCIHSGSSLTTSMTPSSSTSLMRSCPRQRERQLGRTTRLKNRLKQPGMDILNTPLQYSVVAPCIIPRSREGGLTILICLLHPTPRALLPHFTSIACVILLNTLLYCHLTPSGKVHSPLTSCKIIILLLCSFVIATKSTHFLVCMYNVLWYT